MGEIREINIRNFSQILNEIKIEEGLMRYNVFCEVSRGRKVFNLEYLRNGEWGFLADINNHMEYPSLSRVASRITSITPREKREYIRIISNEPLDKRDGRKTGINLFPDKAYLIRILTAGEQEELFYNLLRNYSLQQNDISKIC